ncbi:MAG: SH3 domain-containing protein [Caldilineales bacterium]|nr:SH3 domain-containing protein [Caldilineales bacterium]MCW5857148.1 SH3 domain-containing protein [Caldilineales bacterium]
MNRLAILLACLLLILLAAACGGNPEPTPIPVAAAPTETPASTATTAPTNTPEPEPTATPTAISTDTPQPTATPTSTPLPQAEVIVETLNLRGGPDTTYPVMGKAARGETLTVLARSQDGSWLEVQKADGKTVWVAARLVQLSAPVETLAVSVHTPPTATPVPSTVRLLFAYSPGCPHCSYQRPIIADFQAAHPEVKVTRVEYSALSATQRRLIAGTSGHPVMVFYSDSGDDIRQIVSETPLGQMDTEYRRFLTEVARPSSSKTTTGSYVT